MAVKIQGEVNRDTARDMIAREYDMQRLVNLANSPHILRARGASSRETGTPPIGLGYLYLDWAPYGSLRDLVESAHGAVPGSDK
jgi:hypothetical protein